MSKYQEALDKLCNRCFGDDPKKILQELVDKETPMKVDKIDWTPKVIYRCVKCGKKITNGNYCINCGQALDWSDE